MPWTVARLPVVVVLLTGAFLGCSEDDGGTPGTSSSSGAPSSSTTATPPAAPCPEDDPAPGEAVEDPLPADVDGDGADDEVVVTVVDDRTMAVEVGFAAGGRTVVVHDDPSVATVAPVRLARAADVDADGDDDLWLVVGSGATVEILSLVLADGCDLVRPEVDGQPNTFAVGASVGAIAGVECGDLDADARADGFLEHVAERAGGSTYEGTSTEWFVESGPSGLRRGDASPFTVDIETDDVTRYGELTCP